MSIQEQSATKSLHIKLPVEVLAVLQDLALKKTLRPSTYARTILVQHVNAEQRRQERTDGALKAGVAAQQEKTRRAYE